jgi:hypothetical protein
MHMRVRVALITLAVFWMFFLLAERPSTSFLKYVKLRSK